MRGLHSFPLQKKRHSYSVITVLISIFTMAAYTTSAASMASSGVGVCKEESDAYDVAIVGGGLAGLLIASKCAEKGKRIIVLEAHPNDLGGRLKNTNSSLDLGGAWVWPHHGQEQVNQLLSQLKIGTFPQHGDENSMRVRGGTFAIIDALAKTLNEKQVRTGWALKYLERNLIESNGSITLTSSEGLMIRAKKVVLTMPPRLIAERVSFSPALDEAKMEAMRTTRTWMGGVTKVCVEYESKFWPAQLDAHTNIGLSGGPAFQMYDASSYGHGTVALTYFALAPADGSLDNDVDLVEACTKQFTSTWVRMGVPREIFDKSIVITSTVMRWPREEFISDELNPTTIHPHPSPVRKLAESVWDNTLMFAGTETDQRSPGVIEGAIGSAYAVLRKIS